jgi:hypothetical protein
VIATLVSGAILTACPTPPDPPPDADADVDADVDADADGDADADDGGTGLGRILVTLQSEGELEDTEVLLTLRVTVSEIVLHNDRGGDLEPSRSDIGERDLLAGEPPLLFDDAPPATYGSVTLDLAPGSGLALFMESSDETVEYRVEMDVERSFEVRCEFAALLAPGGELRFALLLEVEDLQHALVEAGLTPVEGVVTVRPGTTGWNELAAALDEAWELSCASDDDEGGEAGADAEPESPGED